MRGRPRPRSRWTKRKEHHTTVLCGVRLPLCRLFHPNTSLHIALATFHSSPLATWSQVPLGFRSARSKIRLVRSRALHPKNEKTVRTLIDRCRPARGGAYRRLSTPLCQVLVECAGEWSGRPRQKSKRTFVLFNRRNTTAGYAIDHCATSCFSVHVYTLVVVRAAPRRVGRFRF